MTVSTIVMTGSAGGMGRAIRHRLEATGHRIIGVDLRDAEVTADLSTGPGREAMVAEVAAQCDGTLDGLIVAAGIQAGSAATIVSTTPLTSAYGRPLVMPSIHHSSGSPWPGR